MKVSDLGEFALIDRLADVLAGHANPAVSGRLAVGIGDDAAVWRLEGGALIATTDTLVSGVHFLPDKTPWLDLGWKALAVNVSDIAAMGGAPAFALVTLVLPPGADVGDIEDLYRGLADAASAFSVVLAGGDVVRGPETVITVALAGQAALDGAGEPLVLRRNAASPGDLVAVTGALGGAAGGLRVLQEGDQGAPGAAATLIDRHLRPKPRVEAGRAALDAGLRCAIDVSDGLLQDLGHVCRASRVGASVWREKLPVEPALLRVFEPDDALRCAVSGGEDYELLLVGDAAKIDVAARAAAVSLTVIGEIVVDTDHRARLLDESANEIDVPASGWDHLRGGS